MGFKMKSFSDFNFDGEKVLQDVLSSSKYGTLDQAVARLTLFSHPETVAQTACKGLFRVRRHRAGEARGQDVSVERFILCDNSTPTSVFLWANKLKKKDFSECQFNHVYGGSENDELYTSLANICVTPAFLGKVTDKNDSVKAMLKYRVYVEYGFETDATPTKPMGYDSLIWGPYLDKVDNLEDVLKSRLRSCSRCRAAISREKYGWFFEPRAIVR